jgi:hypothetical protein
MFNAVVVEPRGFLAINPIARYLFTAFVALAILQSISIGIVVKR